MKVWYFKAQSMDVYGVGRGVRRVESLKRTMGAAEDNLNLRIFECQGFWKILKSCMTFPQGSKGFLSGLPQGSVRVQG